MKSSKYLLLILSLASVLVQAETIETHVQPMAPGAPGTTTKVCGKVVLIKRNSGTLIQGLTTANLKPYKSSESVLGSGSRYRSRNFSLTYSLTASTTPIQAGLYDLCLTPSGAGLVWQKPDTTAYAYFYYIHGIVHGNNNSDNGIFEITLNSQN
jgi:hypothetical protein